VAVAEMGSISPRPHYVLPPSFAQTRGPNVSHKLPLDSLVNLIVMILANLLLMLRSSRIPLAKASMSMVLSVLTLSANMQTLPLVLNVK